jgi:hypothetical protein
MERRGSCCRRRHDLVEKRKYRTMIHMVILPLQPLAAASDNSSRGVWWTRRIPSCVYACWRWKEKLYHYPHSPFTHGSTLSYQLSPETIPPNSRSIEYICMSLPSTTILPSQLQINVTECTKRSVSLYVLFYKNWSAVSWFRSLDTAAQLPCYGYFGCDPVVKLSVWNNKLSIRTTVLPQQMDKNLSIHSITSKSEVMLPSMSLLWECISFY